MKQARPYLAAAFAAFGIVAAAAATARAETATLEIKRFGGSDTTINAVGQLAENLYRTTAPQQFHASVGSTGGNSISFGGAAEQAEAFKKLVKKEPKYALENPFRGVAKFGTQEYPFVLDAVEEKPKDKEKSEEAADKDSTDKKDAKEAKSDSPAKEKAENKDKAPKAIRFNRLYFDLNHNGDLTDDEVVKAEGPQGLVALGGNYVRFTFPQINLTVDANGTPVEYAFTLSGYMMAQKEYSYAGVQLNAAAYREGEITLDGKQHHLVLIDYNSNGRFDDEITIQDNVRGSGGQAYPQQGDMLLVDPDPKLPDSPYSPAESKFRNWVSKLVSIDGQYYELKITPAGDKVTLEPSSVALGKVTNPNDGYSAVIYGDRGFLKISGGKDTPSSVPEGEWKLLSYSIDLTEQPKPEKPAEEKAKSEDEGEKKSSTPKAFSAAIKNLLATSPAAAAVVNRRNVVSAQATVDYKPVKVVAGETVEMPFGPPYKPVVNSFQSSQVIDGKQKAITQLTLSLVGIAGEQCTDMTVKGSRPGKPEFTITDPDGKVVQTGNFEYG
jgi:hypothetical protein